MSFCSLPSLADLQAKYGRNNSTAQRKVSPITAGEAVVTTVAARPPLAPGLGCKHARAPQNLRYPEITPAEPSNVNCSGGRERTGANGRELLKNGNQPVGMPASSVPGKDSAPAKRCKAWGAILKECQSAGDGVSDWVPDLSGFEVHVPLEDFLHPAALRVVRSMSMASTSTPAPPSSGFRAASLPPAFPSAEASRKEAASQGPLCGPAHVIGLGPGRPAALGIGATKQECAESGREATPAGDSSSPLLAAPTIKGGGGGMQRGQAEGIGFASPCPGNPPGAAVREPVLIGPLPRSAAPSTAGGSRSGTSGLPSLETLRRAASSCSTLRGQVPDNSATIADTAHGPRQSMRDEPPHENGARGPLMQHDLPVTIPRDSTQGRCSGSGTGDGNPPHVLVTLEQLGVPTQVTEANGAVPCVPALPTGAVGHVPGGRAEATLAGVERRLPSAQGAGTVAPLRPPAENGRQWPPPLPSGKAQKLRAALLALDFAPGSDAALEATATYIPHAGPDVPQGGALGLPDTRGCTVVPHGNAPGLPVGPAARAADAVVVPLPAKEASDSRAGNARAFDAKAVAPALPIKRASDSRVGGAARFGEEGSKAERSQVIIPHLPIARPGKVIPRLPIGPPCLPRAPRLPIARPSLAPSMATTSSSTGPSPSHAVTSAARDPAPGVDTVMVGKPDGGPPPCAAPTAATFNAGVTGDAAVTRRSDAGAAPVQPGVGRESVVSHPAGGRRGAPSWAKPWLEMATAKLLGEEPKQPVKAGGVREDSTEGGDDERHKIYPVQDRKPDLAPSLPVRAPVLKPSSAYQAPTHELQPATPPEHPSVLHPHVPALPRVAPLLPHVTPSKAPDPAEHTLQNPHGRVLDPTAASVMPNSHCSALRMAGDALRPVDPRKAAGKPHPAPSLQEEVADRRLNQEHCHEGSSPALPVPVRTAGTADVGMSGAITAGAEGGLPCDTTGGRGTPLTDVIDPGTRGRGIAACSAEPSGSEGEALPDLAKLAAAAKEWISGRSKRAGGGEAAGAPPPKIARAGRATDVKGEAMHRATVEPVTVRWDDVQAGECYSPTTHCRPTPDWMTQTPGLELEPGTSAPTQKPQTVGGGRPQASSPAEYRGNWPRNPARKRGREVDCKYWRFGKCAKGDTCPFTHVGLPITRHLKCRTRGTCHKGESCVFNHDPAHKEPCKKLFREEYCPRGAACPFSHDPLDPAEVPDLLQFWNEPGRLRKHIEQLQPHTATEAGASHAGRGTAQKAPANRGSGHPPGTNRGRGARPQSDAPRRPPPGPAGRGGGQVGGRDEGGKGPVRPTVLGLASIIARPCPAWAGAGPGIGGGRGGGGLGAGGGTGGGEVHLHDAAKAANPVPVEP